MDSAHAHRRIKAPHPRRIVRLIALLIPSKRLAGPIENTARAFTALHDDCFAGKFRGLALANTLFHRVFSVDVPPEHRKVVEPSRLMKNWRFSRFVVSTADDPSV